MTAELIGLVLDGTKTATASAEWDYDADSEAVPRVGDLAIVLERFRVLYPR